MMLFMFQCTSFALRCDEKLKPDVGMMCVGLEVVKKLSGAGPDISGAHGEIATRGPYYKDHTNNLISF